MENNTALNTILMPVIAAMASATLTLLVKEAWLAAFIGAVVTFALAYCYEVLP